MHIPSHALVKTNAVDIFLRILTDESIIKDLMLPRTGQNWGMTAAPI